MLVSSCGAHLEDQVLQTSGLCSRPVNTSRRRAGCNVRRIKDEVSNLAKKDIGRAPVEVLGVVWVCINQSETLEVR